MVTFSVLNCLVDCMKLDISAYYEQLVVKVKTGSCRAVATGENGGCGCQAIRDSAAASIQRSECRDGGIAGEGY